MTDIQKLLNEASERIQALVKSQAELVDLLREQQKQLDLFPQTPALPQTKRTVRINVEQPQQSTTPNLGGRKPEPNSKSSRLLALIGQGYKTSRALAQQTGLSIATVSGALNDMRSQGLIQKIGTEKNEKAIPRVVTLPVKPYNVYTLTGKGQTRLQGLVQTTAQTTPTTTSTPAPMVPAPQQTTQRQPSFEHKVKEHNKLAPRDKALLNLIQLGCRKATELAKSTNVSFQTVTQSLYWLQRQGLIKIENTYKNRPNCDNRMARHLVDRIVKLA